MGAVRGRGRPLIPFAAALALALATTHYATLPAASETSGTYIRPATLHDFDGYSALGATVTLDLTDVVPDKDDGGVKRRIDVVAGHVVVLYPRHLSLSYDVEVDWGSISRFAPLPPETGVGLESESTYTYENTPVRLALTIRVRFGTVEVRRAEA